MNDSEEIKTLSFKDQLIQNSLLKISEIIKLFIKGEQITSENLEKLNLGEIQLLTESIVGKIKAVEITIILEKIQNIIRNLFNFILGKNVKTNNENELDKLMQFYNQIQAYVQELCNQSEMEVYGEAGVSDKMIIGGLGEY